MILTLDLLVVSREKTSLMYSGHSGYDFDPHLGCCRRAHAKFCSYLIIRQTDGQTDRPLRIDSYGALSPAEIIHLVVILWCYPLNFNIEDDYVSCTVFLCVIEHFIYPSETEGFTID